MLKKFQVHTVSKLAALLLFIAHSGFSTNCWSYSYEPEIPDCLKK